MGVGITFIQDIPDSWDSFTTAGIYIAHITTSGHLMLEVFVTNNGSRRIQRLTTVNAIKFRYWYYWATGWSPWYSTALTPE